jgi:ribose/xylose/arabinose/galactoside ABC-type transport system permease subunit
MGASLTFGDSGGHPASIPSAASPKSVAVPSADAWGGGLLQELTAGPPPSVRSMAAWSRQAGTYGVWIALAAILLVALLTAPEFFGISNLQDVLRRASILGIVTMGQVLVLMTAGLDLSVGAMIGMTAVLMAESARSDGPPLELAILAALGLAIGVGLVNGLLIARRRVPPFVATFGMLIVLEGLRLAYTAGTASGNVPDVLRSFGQATLVGIPWPTVALLLLIVALTVFTQRTVPGRRLVLAGANERMAFLSGVPVVRLKVVAYVTCAALAVVAGIFFAAFIGYVDRFVGRGADLDSISAALIGGTLFAGGEGSFVRAAAGALLIVALVNLIVLNGLSIEWQYVAKGLVLVAAVALQTAGRQEGSP